MVNTSPYTKEEQKKREKKKAAVLWPFGGEASAPSFLSEFLFAPNTWGLRVGLGMAVAFNIGWGLTRWAAARSAAPGPVSVNFPRHRTSASLEMPRPFLKTMITGFKNIINPEIGLEGEKNSPSAKGDDEDYGYAPPIPTDGLMRADRGAASLQDEIDKEKAGKGAGLGEGGEGLARSGGLGGGGAGAGGAASPLAFPSGKVNAALADGNPGGKTGGAGDAGVSGRPKTPAGPLARRMITTRRNSRGALGQLRFAENLSRQGQLSPTAESSYQAASNAFTGQTAQGGGAPVGGAGAAAAPAPPTGAPATRGEPTPQAGRNAGPSCPAGYTFDYESYNCVPLAVENVTPWQGLLNMSRIFLIVGAILAAIGLFLIMKGKALFGGLLLGAALAFVVAGVSIGWYIGNHWGQQDQASAISSAGTAASQGQAPR